MAPSKRNVSQILVIVNFVANQTSTGITHQTNAELPVWFSALRLWCAVILSEDGIPRHTIATMCTCRYYHAAVVRMMSFTHATGWPAFTPWTLATQRYSASISGSLYVCNISLFRSRVPCRLKGHRIFPNVFPILTCSPTTTLFLRSFSAVTSRLRSSQTFPKVHTRTHRYCSFMQYSLNHYQHITNKS